MLAMCGRKVERITLCIYTDLYTTRIGGRRRPIAIADPGSAGRDD